MEALVGVPKAFLLQTFGKIHVSKRDDNKVETIKIPKFLLGLLVPEKKYPKSFGECFSLIWSKK